MNKDELIKENWTLKTKVEEQKEIIDAFSKEIEELYKRLNENDWISVEDKLPEKNQKGLCIQDPLKTGTREPLWFIFDGKFFLPPDIATIYATYEVGKSSWVDITYWMPLPEWGEIK